MSSSKDRVDGEPDQRMYTKTKFFNVEDARKNIVQRQEHG
jgi:hypothetical protein